MYISVFTYLRTYVHLIYCLHLHYDPRMFAYRAREEKLKKEIEDASTAKIPLVQYVVIHKICV